MKKVRLFSRVGMGALVIGSLVSVVAPAAPAHAAAGGAMTITNGTVHGTSGDDLFILTRDDALTVSHNRFAAGDPGFASATDFDSSTEGVQPYNAQGGMNLNFDLGSGDDVIKVVGGVQPLAGNVDMGSGADTVDFSGSPGASFGAGPTIEKLIGSSGDDILSGTPNQPSLSITILGGGGKDQLYGTEGNDVLDASGGGYDALDGRAGNDTLLTSLPLLYGQNPIKPGDGDDTLTITGTEGEDNLTVAPPRQPEFDVTPEWVEIEEIGIQAGVHNLPVEHLKFQLLGGDDTLAVAPTNTSLFVDGGAGDDELDLDAGQATITKTIAGDQTNLSVPDRMRDRVMPVTTTSLENTYGFNETLIATATGPGGGPHVRVLRANGSPVASFYAYGPNFPGGVNVAMGDLDGDGDDEVITGVGPGGGPHVRAFHSDGSDAGTSFYAYDPGFTGGVNVAAIDLDGDGFSEIVTAPASGGGPHIRIWSGEGELLDEWFAGFPSGGLNIARGPRGGEVGGDLVLVSSAAGNLSQVVAYEAFGDLAPGFTPLNPYAPNFQGGAFVARGEFAGGHARDGKFDEVVTGAGPGGGPDVRVYQNANGSWPLVSSFYAFGATFPGGVNIATCNPDAGDDELLVGAGGGGAPHVRLLTKTGGALPLSFYAYGEDFHGGVRVACGGGGVRQL
jgi:hypothetical protein